MDCAGRKVVSFLCNRPGTSTTDGSDPNLSFSDGSTVASGPFFGFPDRPDRAANALRTNFGNIDPKALYPNSFWKIEFDALVWERDQ
jgi:hypothetical protein